LSSSNTPALKPTPSIENRRASSLIGRSSESSASAAPVRGDQREVIDERFRKVSLRAELGHRRGAVPLRQKRVVRSHHHRHVREIRRRKPKRLVEQNLPRRVRQMVFPADHIRHLHQRIVDHDREVVRRKTLGANDDRIADDVGMKPDRPADGVTEDNFAIVGHAEPDCWTLARRDARLRLLACDRSAFAGVPRRLAGRERGVTLRVELGRGTETVIRGTCGHEFVRVGAVQMDALRLTIRAERAADVRPFIPVEAEPDQIAQDRRLRLPG
jgi:hypothetical protein